MRSNARAELAAAIGRGLDRLDHKLTGEQLQDLELDPHLVLAAATAFRNDMSDHYDRRIAAGDLPPGGADRKWKFVNVDVFVAGIAIGLELARERSIR